MCKEVMVESKYWKKLKKRFWNKVDKREEDECWNWTASCIRGYGKIYYGSGGVIFTHRLSWIIHFGSIPKGKLVLHKCDNRKCVNPKHLYVGTHSDNMHDRFLRNPSSSNAKFYSGEIWLIRRLNILKYGKRKVPVSLMKKIFKASVRTTYNIWNSRKYLCKEGYYV